MESYRPSGTTSRRTRRRGDFTRRSALRKRRDRQSSAAHTSEPRTSFEVDAMLGSLARKLRAMGYEATYHRSGEDSALLEDSLANGSVILTCDRRLVAHARAAGAKVILVTGRGDGQRLAAISSEARRAGVRLSRGEPLCSLCGGRLASLERSQVAGKVPPSVEGRHREFFRCHECGHFYWKGSHWKKLRSLSRRFEQSHHVHGS